MTFLNPLALFALAAAAIPLIIHLFNFRRPKKVDFSSLEFLKELQKSTMQRVRIKQWLLLVLRTLAIACLVLAFARPTLTGGLAGTLGGRAPTSVALVLDNSLSMTLRDAQGAYLDQARRIAATLIDQLEPGDEIFVVSGADETVPAAFRNRAPALEALGGIAAQPGVPPASRLLARAGARLAEASHLNREVYLISDLQRSTLVDSAASPLPPGVRARLIPVGQRTYANVAVTDVTVRSRIVEVGQPVRIEATLVNYGPAPVEGYVASLYLEDERVAQATADLAPNQPTTVLLTATPQRRGWLAGVVEIEDDAFAYDNLRYVTLHVPEQRRLLVVQGEDEPIEYLRLALSARLTRGRVAFEVETIPESRLAATALGGYDAVVLVGPRDLSSGETAALARYVEGGGGLLLFPGAAARPADYDALFRALGGGRFAGFSGELGADRTVTTFDRADLEHPLFEGLFEQIGTIDGEARLERPDLFFALNYNPSTGTEQTLIRLSNGFPFLQEIRHGRGAALLMAVAPNLRWSDLPVRGLFIPLLYRSIYYLSAGEAVQGDRLITGEPAELRLSGVPETAPVELVGPDGEAFIPEQRSLFGAALLTLDATPRRPGIYDVRTGDRLIRRVVFNLDPRESDLRPEALPEAAARLGQAVGTEVQVLDVRGGLDRVAAALEAERTGVELWNVFLMLALGFLVAEMIVAMQWRPEAVPA
ncbi:hypothetical protein AWN76_012520 [Rhodothermaceae bacterium RA]|nr:hypothetical protein AWN76_012520 [Rhodothermaceae bacterium RA]